MSEETTFTPGPWKHWEHADSSGLCIGPPYSEKWMTGEGDAGFRVRTVCTVSGMGRSAGVNDQERANARLIAAAPELLEALQTLMTWVDAGFLSQDNPAVLLARAAITKATTP